MAPPRIISTAARALASGIGSLALLVACTNSNDAAEATGGAGSGASVSGGDGGLGGASTSGFGGSAGGNSAGGSGAGASSGTGAAGGGGSGVGSGGGGADGGAGAGGQGSNAGVAGGSNAGVGGGGASGAPSGGGGNGGTAGARGGAGGASGSAGKGSAGSAGATGGPVTVFLAGDSTVSTYANTASPSDQAGWGQMIGALFDTRVTIQNRASGGQTARRFIDENKLATIWNSIRAGDYLLVQFGTNDGNRTATYTLGGQSIPYYLDPATDFKTYLQQYIDGARSRGATPVFVTPPPRNSAYCTGGNGTGSHAQAMRELGAAQNVSVSDLNAKTVAHLRAICPAPTPEDFFLLRADGSVNGTHFQENGARILAGFVADGLRDAASPLLGYLR